MTGQSTSPAHTSTSTRPRAPSPRRSSTHGAARAGHARTSTRPVPSASGGAPSTCSAASASAQPAPRSVGATRAARPPRPPRPAGPGTARRTRASSGARSAEPSVRPTRTMPVPSGRRATASGGRLGPRRTTSSRRHSDPDGLTGLVGELPRAGRHGAVPLPSERAPVGQRRGRGAAGPAPAGVRLDVGGFDPGRLQRDRPVARRARSTGCDSGHGAVAALDASAAGAGGPDPGARGASAPSWTSAPGGAESSAKPPPPRTTPVPELWKAGPSTWDRQAASTGFAGRPSAERPRARRRRARRRRPRRWTATRCSGTGGPAEPPRRRGREGGRPARPSSSAARRITMPGVQKPHWLAPCGTNAAAQRSRSSPGAPSSVVTRRPATRRTGVTQATRGAPSTHTVQHPHCPCGLQPSLTERQPSSSRSASRSEIPSRDDDGVAR